jgi:hypothetical protein
MMNMHVGPVDSVVFGKPLQLGITVDSDPEMPKTDVESVPFALGLRGLRVENSGVAGRPPNLIGGSATNSVGSDLFGVTISGGGAFPPGKDPNRVEAYFGTIGGGAENVISTEAAGYATIAGGSVNEISHYVGSIGGGTLNEVNGDFGVVAGGTSNTAGLGGAVGGGGQNSATGSWSTVPGGSFNSASGEDSFAAGSYAHAQHEGTFVWQDATATAAGHTLTTFRVNMFRARASGGFYFQTAEATAEHPQPLSVGAVLGPNEGTWAELSSRELKKEFEEVDVRDVLKRLADLDIQTWMYLGQEEEIRHMGPVSQDFYAAFGLGIDEEHISGVDADGVALAAIQGLYELVAELQAENEQMRTVMRRAGLR